MVQSLSVRSLSLGRCSSRPSSGRRQVSFAKDAPILLATRLIPAHPPHDNAATGHRASIWRIPLQASSSAFLFFFHASFIALPERPAVGLASGTAQRFQAAAGGPLTENHHGNDPSSPSRTRSSTTSKSLISGRAEEPPQAHRRPAGRQARLICARASAAASRSPGDRLADAEAAIVDSGKKAVRATDDYVHENPGSRSASLPASPSCSACWSAVSFVR